MSDSTLPVMARAYSMLVKAQERDSLMALYGYARRTEAKLHVASIDCQLHYDMSDPFNETYMRSIFDLGTREMLSDALWKDEPLFTVAASPYGGQLLAVILPSIREPGYYSPGGNAVLPKASSALFAWRRPLGNVEDCGVVLDFP
ncbi:hypothetical protein CCGE531_30100 (plasmid) [Rhizobium sp. CCGE531]|uniref:Uncharacterized protein n=2 Tax=Rhizobium TaxID=379 RepID=A0A1C3X8X9_9HYPH|nr:hypothetical protein CCGE531_30100 [Rhizobium sp. CCGE531]AYG76714.1 hypothetical protein CCGE532_29655 [Rhizobium sp. CCGE532]MBB4245321.1 hypothetical protein [Rhizobium tropici]MBB6489458.1 hypothetical protein [Rhizobium lusitanum]MBB5596680.1 hypothetical protein [Rhizobium tropici]